jgi:hypothetical protein
MIQLFVTDGPTLWPMLLVWIAALTIASENLRLVLRRREGRDSSVLKVPSAMARCGEIVIGARHFFRWTPV